MSADERVPELVADAFRHGWSRLVAGLTRVFGSDRVDLAEDLVQDAMVRALRTWPFHGVPDDVEAWLARVARNAGIDRLRRERLERAHRAELERWAASWEPERRRSGAIADDTLRLMFLCCHPRLTPSSRVALTLKTMCGFGVAEVAAALLAKPATVAQRLARARATLQRERPSFELPPADELTQRMTSVLDVIYLLFNEGYRAHAGSHLIRDDLIAEAIRLGELTLAVPGAEPGIVHALLALMAFASSRRGARIDAAGEPLTLASQDRTRWDATWIARGFSHLERSIGGDRLTRFHLEAAIASCHAAAPTYAETDWRTILTHYDALVALGSTPLLRLNRAVAVAKVHGAEQAVAELDAIAASRALDGYHLLPATRAQLEWSCGDHAAAAESLRLAAGMAGAEPERAFFERRLAACRRGAAAPDF